MKFDLRSSVPNKKPNPSEPRMFVRMSLCTQLNVLIVVAQHPTKPSHTADGRSPQSRASERLQKAGDAHRARA